MKKTGQRASLSLNFSETDLQPLAARMRPTRLTEYVGQQHLLAVDKPLYRAISAGHLHSMILWGPPGTGKTTLAELMGHYTQAQVLRLSAVSAGVKEIRDVMQEAEPRRQMGERTLLFIDEIHRFNKSQQDALLPYVEKGTVTLIGATTENPSFALNSALLSRARVYLLKSLTDQDILVILQQALNDSDKGLGQIATVMQQDVLWQIAQWANGDARRALNTLEMLVDSADEDDQQQRVLTTSLLQQLMDERSARFDNQGDRYYDLISALHKSVRGSAPDAALYWYARIISAGGDPLYVARRLLAIASEDIGNADPRALQIALNAWDCFTRVGPAEGERAIAQAIVYLACAAKSNAVYLAFKAAVDDAKQQADYDVPPHLRNAPTELLRSQGYGAEYRYAHDEAQAYAAGENYFPEELKDRRYYHPSGRGLEKNIEEKLRWLQQLDKDSQQRRY